MKPVQIEARQFCMDIHLGKKEYSKQTASHATHLLSRLHDEVVVEQYEVISEMLTMMKKHRERCGMECELDHDELDATIVKAEEVIA